MNDFRKRIKVEQGDMQDIPVYPNSGKQAAIMRLERLISQQMMYVTENNSFSTEEKLEQQNVFFNITKILQNYDELEPTLKKFFKGKAEKERFER